MAYTKTVWQDQEGQVRYTETTDGDYKIFTPNYEEVTEIGTPVNALNMNHIENGIEYCDTNMVKRASLSGSTGGIIVPVYVKNNGEVAQCSRAIPDVSGLTSDVTAIKNTKTVTLTGAVTGSNTINLSSSNSISILTTGKSKTIQLTGAVTGNATLNTGNTDTVSISVGIGSTFNSDGISRLFASMNADFSRGESKSLNTLYTALTDGFLNWRCDERDGGRNLYINDVIVARVGAWAGDDSCGTAAFVPIAKGSTYKCDKKGTGTTTLTFYPLKGV